MRCRPKLTSLVGRDKELAAIEVMLRDQNVRLLTLTGPGGTGKTRLALRVASDLLSDLSMGYFSLPLATIRDPDLVFPTIVKVLELEVPPQSIGGGPQARVARSSAARLLDNFEQLLAAGRYVAELLLACPSSRLSVTSRPCCALAANRSSQFHHLSSRIHPPRLARGGRPHRRRPAFRRTGSRAGAGFRAYRRTTPRL